MYGKRKLSFILSLCMAISLLFTASCGTSKESLLALGDSITQGYALESPENECFINLMAKDKNLTTTNAAVSGAKSEDVKTLVCGGSLDDKILSAKYISLTIGGNDLSAAIYGSVAKRLSEAEGTQIVWVQVKERLLAGDSSTISMLGKVIDEVNSENDTPEKAAFSEAMKGFEANLTDISTYIRDKNPDAKLLVFTYYNPFGWIDLDLLSSSVEGMDKCISAVNLVITENADTLGYIVADAYSAFEGSEERLANAYANSFFDMNLDIHPNAAGHAVLASLGEDALFKS